MTDKEWIEQINKVSNSELIATLIMCNHDHYYDDIYKAVIKEIRKRLDVEYEHRER